MVASKLSRQFNDAGRAPCSKPDEDREEGRIEIQLCLGHHAPISAGIGDEPHDVEEGGGKGVFKSVHDAHFTQVRAR